ncbi:MAG: nucleotidyltransferase family protein [Chitinophagaceae bacterium]|nr:nucleotidyltransferase family protein [Chitinophagaceae bacterium]
MKAMILAAGLGTRLKPFTNKHPKALAEVNGKTLLQRNIEYLLSYGIEEIIVNVHHFAQQIVDFINKNPGFKKIITFSDETDEVLETGGGLMRAEWFLKDSNPFVLMNVDVLTDMNLKEMIESHKQEDCLATLAVMERKTSRYLLFNDDDILCGWTNVKTGEKIIRREADHYHAKAFSGIHVLSPRIFSLITRTGKFSIVDAYLDLAQDHLIKGFDHTESRFCDAGKPESILRAEQLFAED